MICRIFMLLAESGPSALQLALAGIGCALVFEAVSRWRRKSRTVVRMQGGSEFGNVGAGDDSHATTPERRAA